MVHTLVTSNDGSATDDHDAGPDLDAAIVGAGFGGLYMLHRLRELGLSVRVYEMADDVGGTWYWNRYPGARCDSESHIYCYSFDEELLSEWEYSERYPEQPEILEYLRFAADRLDLRRDIEFETAVESAVYDEGSGTWTLTFDDGSTVTTRFFVTAVGSLSEPFVPDFDGLEDFAGEWTHTARWPHEGVEMSGERVGVVGTGSTGIQLIPRVAERADHLTVFQRTPNYAIPAQNRPLTADDWEEIRANYDDVWERAQASATGMPFDNARETAEDLSREEAADILEERWQQGGFRFTRTFGDLLTNEATNEVVAEFIRGKIRERVADPDLAEKLIPTDHPYAAKRPPMDYDGYYETYEREDVELVDVRESPIERVTSDGVRTADAEYDLDRLIFATGFDAMTGTILNIDIRGRDGLTMAEKWADGPRTYLGLAVHGFPNLFTITGPQSPSVLTNMPVAIEQHVEWIADCIEHVCEQDRPFIEATADAEAEWVAQTNEIARETLYDDVDSWYRGENVPGKTETFLPYPGGLDLYGLVCAEVAAEGYEGFEVGGSIPAAPK